MRLYLLRKKRISRKCRNLIITLSLSTINSNLKWVQVKFVFKWEGFLSDGHLSLGANSVDLCLILTEVYHPWCIFRWATNDPFSLYRSTNDFFLKFLNYFQYLVNVNFFILNACITPLFCTFVIQISVDTAHGYTPRAIDMSNVTLSRDLHVSQKHLKCLWFVLQFHFVCFAFILVGVFWSFSLFSLILCCLKNMVRAENLQNFL